MTEPPVREAALAHGRVEHGTSTLLARAVRRDASAVSRLFGRMRHSIERWAHGRLPRWARARLDTGDLVQEAFLRILPRLHRFEPRHREALRAYLRETIRNRIRDEMRRAGKVEVPDPGGLEAVGRAGEQLHQAISSENARKYRSALGRLAEGDRELIVGRLELGYSYEQLALASGKHTPAAARVAVRRAHLRLAGEIASERDASE